MGNFLFNSFFAGNFPSNFEGKSCRCYAKEFWAVSWSLLIHEGLISLTSNFVSLASNFSRDFLTTTACAVKFLFLFLRITRIFLFHNMWWSSSEIATKTRQCLFILKAQAERNYLASKVSLLGLPEWCWLPLLPLVWLHKQHDYQVTKETIEKASLFGLGAGCINVCCCCFCRCVSLSFALAFLLASSQVKPSQPPSSH